VWSISYEGEAIQLPRLTGLEYIAVLLRNAGAEIFSSAVEALSKSDRAIISVSDSLQSYDNVTNGYIRDERLDSTARRQYKERALKVKEEILDARDRGDLNRVSTLESELGSIVEQLGADRGRGGRPRRERDDLERSRIRVTRAIIRAFGKITEQAPETARHLKANITTGTSMIYRDRITHWKL
jgi:hypothetical protein